MDRLRFAVGSDGGHRRLVSSLMNVKACDNEQCRGLPTNQPTRNGAGRAKGGALFAHAPWQRHRPAPASEASGTGGGRSLQPGPRPDAPRIAAVATPRAPPRRPSADAADPAAACVCVCVCLPVGVRFPRRRPARAGPSGSAAEMASSSWPQQRQQRRRRPPTSDSRRWFVARQMALTWVL